MPFPNEHAARVRRPGDFTAGSFRRIKLKGVAGISLIIGRLKGKTTTTTQAYRFAISKFTAKEARAWLKEHKIKTILFEPATGKKTNAEASTEIQTEIVLSEYEKYIASLGADNVNTPAVAGENNSGDAGENIQEDKSMTLKEIMATDPAVKAEVEALQAESKKTGVIEGRAEIQSRIDASVNYIGNENYPKIDALAIKVLKGESNPSALEGAVTAYDMLKEQGNSDDAQGETKKQGETAADAGKPAVDEVEVLVEADRKKIGRA